MASGLTYISDYLLAQSWQIAFLVLGIAMINSMLRNKSAHVRYLLWLIVLAKCLVPPFYAVPLAILPQQERIEQMPMAPSAQIQRMQHEVVNTQIAEPSEPHPVAVKITPPPVLDERGRNFRIHEWLGIGWIIGACLFLTFDLLRALRANLWLWRRRQALPAELRTNIEKLFSAHGVGSFPDVWLVEGFNQPFVWGLMRGSIYLPVDFLNISRPENQRSVLGHELSHILRFDAAVNILQVIAQAIFWFHPLVWWSNRKIRQEREKCCDEMAVARLNTSPRDYSTAILETLAARHEPTRSVPSLAVAGSVKNIEERIKTMLRPGKKFYKQPSLIAATTVLLAAFLTVPTALELTARAQTETPKLQARPMYPLHKAALAGDINKVRLLLSKGADVNGKDEQGRTPLHCAAWCGRKDVAEMLLTNGANVNAMDASGQTPLHQAANFSEGDVPELLIAKGAKVNARDNAGNTPLHVAAGYWDASKGLLELLIKRGADVNARNNEGQTPLHLAASFIRSKYPRDIAAITLIANGADVNVKDKNSRTPLYIAAGNGRRDIAGLLLDRGAVINEKTNDGLTALHRAAMLGRKDVVEVLLNRIGRYDKYAKGIYATDSRGWAAMHYAAQGGYNDIIKLLLDYDADLNVQTKRGETPLHLAVVHNYKDTVNLLISKGAYVRAIQSAAYMGDIAKVKSFLDKGTSANARDEYGLTALHAAAGAGQIKVAEFLISKGAAVNADAVAEGLGTPLHYAGDGGSKEVVELLVSKGANIDARNKNRETPLHLAAKRGYLGLTKLLIDSKANVNAKAQYGWTPLHFAADNGYKDIAGLLIENGADINAMSERTKETPLLCAARSGRKNVMKLLIDKGADISHVDNLLYWACEHGHRDLAELFIKKGANVNSVVWGDAPSLYAVWNNHPDILKLLLDHGANPNAKDRWDWSLLHYTIDSRCRSLDMTRMLLDEGANPNAKITDDGSTPFYWAVGYGLKEVVDLFIIKGANVNAKGNNEGRTALHEASEGGDKDMVEFLIAKGADLNAKDNKGQTPLLLAKEKGHTEIFELLRKHGAKE